MDKTASIIDFKADKKTIQKSTLNSVIIQLIFKLKGFITIPIMTYYLAPKDMGIFNLIIVTASLLTPLFFMNLADGPVIYLVQEKSKNRIKDMYSTVVSSSVLFFILFSIIFLIVISKYSGKNYNYLYFVIPVIFSSIFYKLFSYIFVVFQKTTIVVKNALYKGGLGTILSILLVVIGLSYRGLVYAVIVSEILAGAYIYRFAKREFPLRLFIDKKILLKFLKISLPLLPVFFFAWIIQSSDYYFLLFYKGENYVGKYSVIYSLSSVILILTWALNFFWFPVSARLWIENREKYRKFFITIFTIFSTGLMMAVLLFELNSKVIMQFFARRLEYRDAYVIMGIIAFAFAMQVLITLLTAPLYSNKNVTQIFISFLIGGVLNCALNFLLIPSMEILGAAISTAVSYLIIVVFMSYLNYRVAEFSFFDKRLFYIGGVFFISWIGIVYLREYLHIYQLLIVNFVLLLTLGMLLYFKVLKKDEKQYIYSFFRELRLKVASKA